MNLPDHIHPIAVDEALLRIGMTINEIRALTGDNAPQIIRTEEGLEALDPDAVVIESEDPGDDAWTAQSLMQAIRDGYGTSHDQPDGPFPAVVVATAPQVRAARKALEEA